MCTMDTNPTTSALEGALVSRPDTRRSNKPLMEKKRRQRINRCLNELKTLVLEALRKDPSRYSKLEKADILEMTVRHVQALHLHEASSCRTVGGGRVMSGGKSIGSDDKAKYRAGFIQCAVEVTRYLTSMGGVPNDLHNKVISHLNSVTSSVTGGQGVQHMPGVPMGGASVMVGGGMVTVAPPSTAHTPTTPALVITTAADSSTGALTLTDRPECTPANVPLRTTPPLMSPEVAGVAVPTKSVTVRAGVTLVPARLASGQVALVLPPGTALPLDSSQTKPPTPSHSAYNILRSEPSKITVPSISFSTSSKTIGGAGERTAPPCNTFLKGTENVSSTSPGSDSLFPVNINTSKNIGYTLPKSFSHSMDVETTVSSTQFLSSKNLQNISGNNAEMSGVALCSATSLTSPQPLSPNVDGCSWTQTSSATTQTLTNTLQEVSSTASSSTTQIQASRDHSSGSNGSTVRPVLPGVVATSSSVRSAPTNLQISLSFSNSSREVTSTLSNHVIPSWPIISSSMPVRPTPTVPRGAHSTSYCLGQPSPTAPDNTQSYHHTAHPLVLPANEPSTVSSPPSSPAQEPLNLVTNEQSRNAVYGRRSLKAATVPYWRRAAPYRVPPPGHSSEPWRPW